MILWLILGLLAVYAAARVFCLVGLLLWLVCHLIASVLVLAIEIPIKATVWAIRSALRRFPARIAALPTETSLPERPKSARFRVVRGGRADP